MSSLFSRATMLLLAAGLGLSACTRQEDQIGQDASGQLVLGTAEVESSMTRGVAPGDRTLVLEGFNGTVDLTGTTETTANLEFVRRARGNSDADARDLLDDIDIEESGDDAAYRYVMRSDDPSRTAVDVRGTVPRGTRLQLRLDNGSILLDGIDGPIDVVQRNGSVQIAGAGESVTVETRAGNVAVGMARLPANAQVDVEAANGNVTLALPAGAAARVDARTQVGGVTVESLAFTSRKLEPTGAGAHFTGQLGRGNATVEVTTENGNITLREGPLPLQRSGGGTDLVGEPSEAVEDDLVPDRPQRPLEGLQPADPAAPDTSLLDADDPDPTL